MTLEAFTVNGPIKPEVAREMAIDFENRLLYRDDFRWIVDSYIDALSRLAAAEARAEKAEAESSEVLSVLEAIRAHFLAQIAAGKVGPMPICGWCGEPQKDVESFRSHAVECAKNPSVARAESAEARVAELEGALAGLVYCADCWDNPEHNVCEKHLAPAQAALAPKERSREA